MSTSDDVRAFNERFSAALAAPDVATVVDAFTDDARVLFAGRPIVRGREAIAALFEGWLAQGPHYMRFESTDVWEAGSIVVDVGTIRTPAGSSKYVVLYERQTDGSLKIAVDAVTSDGDS